MDEVGKSRSQLKREETERQEIGFRFIELSPVEVDRLPLDEKIRNAVHRAAGETLHNAKRRSRLHVGTVLRDVPLETLREIVSRIESGDLAETGSRQVDAWVEGLFEDETKAIGELGEGVPDLDISRLRQLLRNARREARAVGAVASSGGRAAPAVPGAGAGTGSRTDPRTDSRTDPNSDSGADSDPGLGAQASPRTNKSMRALREYLTELLPDADVSSGSET